MANNNDNNNNNNRSTSVATPEYLLHISEVDQFVILAPFSLLGVVTRHLDVVVFQEQGRRSRLT